MDKVYLFSEKKIIRLNVRNNQLKFSWNIVQQVLYFKKIKITTLNMEILQEIWPMMSVE